MQAPEPQQQRLWRLWPILAIVAMGILLTWPLPAAPEDAYVDGWFSMAQIWSVDLVADALLEDGQIPGYTYALHWPQGGWASVIGWQFVLPLLLANILGASLLPSMNLLIALQLLAAALATYALLRRLGAGPWAAAAAAVYYGYHPWAFHLMVNGQFTEICHWGLPLLAVLLLQGGAWKPGWRTAAMAPVFGLLMASSPYAAITGAVLCACIGTWALLCTAPQRRRATALALTLAAAAVAVGALPFLLYYFVLPRGYDPLFAPSSLAQIGDPRLQDLPCSTSLAGWFVPFRLFADHWQAMGGGRVAPAGTQSGPISLDHVIGLVAMGLAVVGCWRWRAAPGHTGELPLPGRRFWLTTAAVFTLLSSGYYLILYPHSHLHHAWSAIPLPLQLMRSLVPATDAFASPYRLAPGVLLVAAVLAGMGLDRLARALRGWKRPALLGAAMLAMAAEGAWADITTHPITMEHFEVPQVYRDLALEPDRDGLLTVPWWSHPKLPNLQAHQLWQHIHRHPLHHDDQGIIQPAHMTAFTYEITRALTLAEIPEPTSEAPGVPARWIVVHEEVLLPNQWGALEVALQRNAHLVRRYERDRIQLWEVAPERILR